MKATAISPANIAFIKYWGRKDSRLFLPLTTTNSMNLNNCTATTTIEFGSNFKEDEIIIKGEDGKERRLSRDEGDKTTLLFTTLERMRQKSGKDYYAQVYSSLSFPLSAGIASSAAGMSAFVAAGYSAIGLDEIVNDKKELSREVRLAGSVSAARSVEDGFTEALYGENHEKSYVRQIAHPAHWDLRDIVVVLNTEKKKISSSLGHELAPTSPFFKARIQYLKGKPEIVRKAILAKDFSTLTESSERDAINMHAVMMTSNPPAYYLSSGSMEFIKNVINWRNEGIDVFFTFDAGSNPHLITTSKFENEVRQRAESISYTQFTITNEPCVGTRIIDNHLF